MNNKKIAYVITRNAKTVSVLCANAAKKIDGSPVAWITETAKDAALMVTTLIHFENGNMTSAPLKGLIVNLDEKFRGNVTLGKRLTFYVMRDADNEQLAWSKPLSRDEMSGLNAFRVRHNIDADTPIVVELGKRVEDAGVDTSADNVEVVYMDALVAVAATDSYKVRIDSGTIEAARAPVAEKPTVKFAPKAPEGIVQTTPIKSNLTVPMALANALASAQRGNDETSTSKPTNRHHNDGRGRNRVQGANVVPQAVPMIAPPVSPPVPHIEVVVDTRLAITGANIEKAFDVAKTTPSATEKPVFSNNPFAAAFGGAKATPTAKPVQKPREPRQPAEKVVAPVVISDADALDFAIKMSGLSAQDFAVRSSAIRSTWIKRAKAALMQGKSR